eukprot:COSAG05_NODE_203_length_14207_cov_24.645379_8_plen_65_part_00
MHAGYEKTLASMGERLADERRQRELVESQDAGVIASVQADLKDTRQQNIALQRFVLWTLYDMYT